MRFSSVLWDGEPHVVVKGNDGLLSLTLALSEGPTDMLQLLAIPDYLARVERALAGHESSMLVPASRISCLLPAVARPGKIICLGLNYKDHAIELGKEFPDFPVIFLRGATSLTGHNQPILLPRVSNQLDFEAELAVVINKKAHHISASDAHEYVFGVACFNDASVRDYQLKNPQITAGKVFDKTGALGPEIVTLGELPKDPDDLQISCRLNGEVMQSSNTNQHIFKVGEAIEILSQMMTLEAGDVIAFGTPGGVGMARDPQVWMKPGDVCEIEIEGVGCLRNVIVAEK